MYYCISFLFSKKYFSQKSASDRGLTYRETKAISSLDFY